MSSAGPFQYALQQIFFILINLSNECNFFILEKENNEESILSPASLRSLTWQVGKVWDGVLFDNDHQLFHVVILAITTPNQHVKSFGRVVIKHRVSIGIYSIICRLVSRKISLWRRISINPFFLLGRGGEGSLAHQANELHTAQNEYHSYLLLIACNKIVL